MDNYRWEHMTRCSGWTLKADQCKRMAFRKERHHGEVYCHSHKKQRMMRAAPSDKV